MCNELTETRRRIALSRSVPEYLVDRALMWEATALFLRGAEGDLQRALEQLERLRESKGRAGLKQDTYNAAVVCRLLGREKLKSAHARLLELDQVTDKWEGLVASEKAYLLANAEYRKVWDKLGKDVLAWKTELVGFASSNVQSSSDEFSHELRRVRPRDDVLWNAILAAELDYPEPSRPANRSKAAITGRS